MRARLTDGCEIYPHRRDLFAKNFYKCDACSGYVGCHPGTTNALGTPANAELRNARSLLHERMIDPLWQTADQSVDYKPEDEAARLTIRRAARSRVYAYLAFRMKLTRDQTHTGMFTIEQCREAWRCLQGITYPEIRDWYKSQKGAA